MIVYGSLVAVIDVSLVLVGMCGLWFSHMYGNVELWASEFDVRLYIETFEFSTILYSTHLLSIYYLSIKIDVPSIHDLHALSSNRPLQ